MSPSTVTNNNDILTDEICYLWEFGARMTLARKEILHQIAMKPEVMIQQATVEWITADLKELAIIARILGPVFQSTIRNASSVAHARNIRAIFTSSGACTIVSSFANSYMSF